MTESVPDVLGSRLRPGISLALLALALWLASLALPAIGARGGPTLTGLDVLFQGWSGWRYGVLAWFANPALLAAVAASLGHASRTALGAALLGLVLALSTVWSGDLAALAGRSVPELSYGPGFYLWMAAHTAAVIGGAWERVRRMRLRM